MNRPVPLLVGLLFLALSAAAAPPPPFQVFSNAVLVANHPANDGDSFMVSAGGIRHHFRLYYADCPESRATQDADFQRVREQRRYFGLTNEAAVIRFGKSASAFTGKALEKPFTVHTAFAGALGRSDDKRYYAFIRTADGRDLAETLVRQGLARAHGSGRETPDGVPQDEYRAWLADLEAAAMLKRRGIWAEADQDQIADLRALTRREERDLAAVRDVVKNGEVHVKVRLNHASLEELEALPGVGEATARRIQEGRPWRTWDALDKLPGVGPATLEKWRGQAVLE